MVDPVQGAPERWELPFDFGGQEMTQAVNGPYVRYDAYADKVRELEAEVAAVSAAIKTVRFMDPPDGGDVSLAEQIARMRLALEAAEARLASEGVAVAWRLTTKRPYDLPDSVEFTDDVELVEVWRGLPKREYASTLTPLYAHPASDTALREALEAADIALGSYFQYPGEARRAKEARKLVRAALNPTSEKNDG